MNASGVIRGGGTTTGPASAEAPLLLEPPELLLEEPEEEPAPLLPDALDPLLLDALDPPPLELLDELVALVPLEPLLEDNEVLPVLEDAWPPLSSPPTVAPFQGAPGGAVPPHPAKTTTIEVNTDARGFMARPKSNSGACARAPLIRVLSSKPTRVRVPFPRRPSIPVIGLIPGHPRATH